MVNFSSHIDQEKQKYVEITASFAVDPEISDRFDLMLGFHPYEKRILDEDEDNIPIEVLRCLRRSDLLNLQKPWKRAKMALLWLKLFPEIDSMIKLKYDDMLHNLWQRCLENTQILQLAYAFYHSDLYSENGTENCRINRLTRDTAANIQQEITESSNADSRTLGKLLWTLPFSADCPLGKLVEGKAGLSKQLKKRVGITKLSPGLLCNYFLRRNILMENLLDPHQFEDFTSAIFVEEGWTVERMKKTRDGGKDIIAKQEIDGVPTVAYVQVKRQLNPVGEPKVKEFVATLAGDKIDKGFFVTTSYFTEPAKRWLKDKGASLATIETIDRQSLETKMQRIANREIAAYLMQS
ncbi:restriction endonuclease [uncultured Nostoc sp.]|uniref:restriction endonuclease n=1 Tax=uncultured Nostoc sp. TaxID=340711 RepID=UPI0035CBA923